MSSVPSSTSAFNKPNITTTTNNNKSWVGRRAAKKEMQCEELSDQMQNMGIYDRCEKDVKNCRPHSLKPEEGLLMIDKDFLCLFVYIHLTPKGTKS